MSSSTTAAPPPCRDTGTGRRGVLRGADPPRPPSPERIEDLLERVARADQTAFDELYTRVSAPVYGVIRRVLRDPAQSEEVAQEVLIFIWQNATRYEPTRGSAMGWIMTIAQRRAIDRVRSEQATTARHQRLAAHDFDTDYDCVAEEVESNLDRAAVRRCLDCLTPTQRQAVQLAYYGGHTYREVADLLGVPLGTVKTRIRDGLIRLRDCLGVAGLAEPTS